MAKKKGQHERTEEISKKISESLKKYYSNPENRIKRSQKLKEYYSDPEHRKIIAEQSRKYHSDPDNRRKLAESLKQYYSDPDNKNRLIAPLLNPTNKELARQGRLKYYETHPAHNKGVKHTKETRDKMKKGMIQYWKDRRNNKK